MTTKDLRSKNPEVTRSKGLEEKAVRVEEASSSPRRSIDRVSLSLSLPSFHPFSAPITLFPYIGRVHEIGRRYLRHGSTSFRTLPPFLKFLSIIAHQFEYEVSFTRFQLTRLHTNDFYICRLISSKIFFDNLLIDLYDTAT